MKVTQTGQEFIVSLPATARHNTKFRNGVVYRCTNIVELEGLDNEIYVGSDWISDSLTEVVKPVTADDEQLLFQYFLDLYAKRRDEAAELLSKREFRTLRSDYSHWHDRKEKFVEIRSREISDVVKELSSISVQDNETDPVLSCRMHTDDTDSQFPESDEPAYGVLSYIYTIVPPGKCQNFAKNSTKVAIFKMKHQYGGKDAANYRSILEKLTK